MSSRPSEISISILAKVLTAGWGTNASRLSVCQVGATRRYLGGVKGEFGIDLIKSRY